MVTVRAATESDAGAIAAVHVASWQQAYAGLMPDALLSELDAVTRTEDWRMQLRKRTGSAIVAVDRGQVVGFSYFSKSRDDDALQTLGEVQAIYVHPSHWRQGCGRALLEESFSRLRAQGFEKVTLWVLAKNTPACRFYQSMGFVENGAEKEHPDTGPSSGTLRQIYSGGNRITSEWSGRGLFLRVTIEPR